MLLPYKFGGEGLTLIEATHLFLIEPLLNASMEEQALSRIHRIGQTSETYAYRFIIKNSIEEIIYENNKRKNDDMFSMSREISFDDINSIYNILKEDSSENHIDNHDDPLIEGGKYLLFS